MIEVDTVVMEKGVDGRLRPETYKGLIRGDQVSSVQIGYCAELEGYVCHFSMLNGERITVSDPYEKIKRALLTAKLRAIDEAEAILG